MNKISKFAEEYFFLSNFYICHVVYEGMSFRSVEAAYQATKTVDMAVRQKFCSIGPFKAKKLGKVIELRPDWEEIKEDVMYACLKSKFSDPFLRRKLLATGHKILEEGNWWKDTFWGVYKGEGENHLGKLLMKLREELKK